MNSNDMIQRLAEMAAIWVRINGRQYHSTNQWYVNWDRMANELYNFLKTMDNGNKQ